MMQVRSLSNPLRIPDLRRRLLFTALMLALTAVLGAAIMLYAHSYFTHPTHDDAARARYANFWPLWFFLWAALNALFLSGDVFNLYVTLELVSFAAVALTALARKPAVLAAAMRL